MASQRGLGFALVVLVGACGGLTTDDEAGRNASKAQRGANDDGSQVPAQMPAPSSTLAPIPSIPPYTPPTTTPPVDDANPVDFSGPVLYWSEGFVVRASRLDGTGKKTVAVGTSEQNYPIQVAVDATASKIYWADNATDAVYRANLDGSSQQQVYRNTSDNFSNPSGMAVDHASGKIFWTEQGGAAVKAAGLDGSSPTTIYTGQFPSAVSANGGTLFFVDNGNDSMTMGDYAGKSSAVYKLSTDQFANPTAVLVDGTDLYWAQSATPSASGGIYKMKNDGTGRALLATAQYPGGIAIDPVTHRVYFGDADDSIAYVEANGTGRTVVYQSTDILANPRGLAIRP